MKEQQRQKAYYEANKELKKAKATARRKANPIKIKDAILRTRYGITLENYNELFASQEGKCKICNTHQSELKRSLFVDHCHISGKVRGLLCSDCNTAIGMLKDNKQLLLNAINYLEESND